MTLRPCLSLSATLLLLLIATPALPDPASAGWYQFRGPSRDGHSHEAGLVRAWPAAGPVEIWRRPLGPGFSGIAIVGDRAFTMDSDPQQEYAVCLDKGSGTERWRVPVGAVFTDPYGNGPRSTPTVDGALVYVVGSRGRLLALRAETGETVFQVDFAAAFGSPLPRWAFATSALVEGDLLIVEVGGTGARAVAALDKRTGATRWTAVEDELAYSSPVALDLLGRRQLVFLTKRQLFALSPEGEQLWSTPFCPDHEITPASPLLVAPDLLMVSSSYDVGAKVVRVSRSSERFTVETAWEGKQMRNHFNSSVAVNGHVYGFDTETLRCLDGATGKERWAKRGLGKGSLIVADGKLITLGERGRLVLLEATPERYHELSAHQVLQGRCWTQPALWQGRLYLRNQEEIVALDLRGETPGGSR
jgi:outer membrane protein assembly factor BamB